MCTAPTNTRDNEKKSGMIRIAPEQSNPEMRFITTQSVPFDKLTAFKKGKKKQLVKCNNSLEWAFERPMKLSFRPGIVNRGLYSSLAVPQKA